MADNRQYTALEWVVREIKETLQEAQRVLEHYANDPEDITQLRFCLTLIHQVYGSLHMVGFHGAAMLAEEMEALTEALLDHQVGDRHESQDVLMRSILQLPDYLEQVQQTKRDYPAVVLSLLNDIRATRGASLLSESTLFTPNLDYAHQSHGISHPVTKNRQQLTGIVHKLRQMYRYAAPSVLHGQDIEGSAGYLTKVADRLQKLLKGTKRHAVWEVAFALFDGLERKIISPSASLKSLLRDLDRELGLLEKNSVSILNQPTDDELLKNLLFSISSVERETPAIQEIKKIFELNQLMPLAQVTQESNGYGVDAATLRSVATAIREEFSAVKAKLDGCLQNDDVEANLDFIEGGLQRVNDTLAVLGVGELRQNINSSMRSIASMKRGDLTVDSKELLTIANTIVETESRLDSALSATGDISTNDAHLDDAQNAVLMECRNGLEKSKDAIVDYIALQWDIERVQVVPNHLREVRGGLSILSLDRASDILSACIRYIESQLIDQQIKPKWQHLDSLADVIASVDYYLEFMSVSRENDESILDKAEQGLATLGIQKADVTYISSTPADSSSQAGQEPSGASVAASPSEIDSDDDFIDEEIIEIFTEEVENIQQTLDEYFPQWAADFTNGVALAETRRAFHTLKGSGRMVKATDIGELAWAIENMLNQVMERGVSPSELHVRLIEKVREILPEMVSAYKAHSPNPHNELCVKYMIWGHQLSRNEQSEDLLNGLAVSSVTTDNLDEEISDVDPQLWEVFSQEAETHLALVNQYIEEMDAARPFYQPPSDAMQRALHTLKGSAFMAELDAIGEIVGPVEKFAKELRSYQVNIDDDIFQLFKDCVAYIQDGLKQIEQNRYPIIPKFEQFLARVDELRERSVGPLIRQKEAEKSQKQVDPAVLEVMMAEEMNLLLDADLAIEEWRHRDVSSEDWQALHDELATLKYGADRAHLPSMSNLCGALQQAYEKLITGEAAASNTNYDTLLDGHNRLMDFVDSIAAGQDLPAEDQTILERLNQLESIAQQNDLGENHLDVTSTVHNDVNLNEIPEPVAEFGRPATDNGEIHPATTDEGEEVLEGELTTETYDELDELDEETVEIFLEEAHELLEELDESIHSWETGAADRESNEAMQRALHTFKGGARLAGLMILGEVAHDFETYLIDNAKGEQADDIFQRIHDYQDQLIHRVAKVNGVHGDAEPVADIENVPPEKPVDEPVINGALPEEPVADLNENSPPDEGSQDNFGNVVPFATKANSSTLLPAAPVVNPPAASPGNQAAARRSQPQEVVKVSADLMEDLVNLAGETAISRGRMEEQVSELGGALDEMGSTVQRLQEQLRRLDIETEAQILFRQEQMAEAEDFDPLEMDRYSQLQQLSRSLIESASDLMDLKTTLSEKTRDTETVLLQQSRINTELQEGLMRSRMVPFSRIVPRLRRIVRQISTELGKAVEMDLNNIEGELDRSMMERMVAPLEHMLRNAIDHGIEDASTRANAGKPEAGRIAIALERDGGDVLIHVADDGAGINVDRVRQKAIDNHLLDPHVQLSDQEVLQFILQAGFSTAETVTQISGRGVGMDVVNSEIRQMGGSIYIDSRLGEGTRFTIRVPFTVSVNRALMVSMGDDHYAIPLNTIEGIVRISPFELEHYYASSDESFEYAGQDYKLQYLGSLLEINSVPRLQGHTLPLPVLLVRSADQSVALQVDHLHGSREIVVKSLGPQFRSVQGLSGATIMGDGHVVVILDLNALIRQRLAKTLSLAPPVDDVSVEPHREGSPLVMVVDDSVTVRKVTTRLLEREGYDVITAKDGVDAMTTLQDYTPDIMLLDIEMPRMDGFEVAKNVRSITDIRALPIIMITSRTGEKHRQRGLESGANIYMGKPYQEEQLLENIRSLLKGAVEH